MTEEEVRKDLQKALAKLDQKKEVDTTKEIKLGFKLPVEFTKIKKRAEDDTGTRVVTQRMRISWKGLKFTFIQRGKNLHYVDTQELRWDEKAKIWKLQYDENWCEPLDDKGVAHRNPIVSLILRDESMMQFIQIAQAFLPLQITKAMAVAMLIFGIMSFLIGFGFNEIFHSAPTTTVHWLTSPPKIQP